MREERSGDGRNYRNRIGLRRDDRKIERTQEANRRAPHQHNEIGADYQTGVNQHTLVIAGSSSEDILSMESHLPPEPLFAQALLLCIPSPFILLHVPVR